MSYVFLILHFFPLGLSKCCLINTKFVHSLTLPLRYKVSSQSDLRCGDYGLLSLTFRYSATVWPTGGWPCLSSGSRAILALRLMVSALVKTLTQSVSQSLSRRTVN